MATTSPPKINLADELKRCKVHKHTWFWLFLLFFLGFIGILVAWWQAPNAISPPPVSEIPGCVLDNCKQCRPGYTGPNCTQCAAGYVRMPGWGDFYQTEEQAPCVRPLFGNEEEGGGDLNPPSEPGIDAARMQMMQNY